MHYTSLISDIMCIACAVKKTAGPDTIRPMFDAFKRKADVYYQTMRSKFDNYGDAVDPNDQWMSDFFAEIDFLSVDLGKPELDHVSCLMRLETMLDLLRQNR